MSTMKAVCIHSFGGPEVLKLESIERPLPQDDEVLIKVRAASVNPVDYKIRSGSFSAVKQQQLPKVLGSDVSGTVERCGRAVRNMHEGDEVYAMLDGGPGGYAEYVTVKARLCAPKPKQLDHASAAAVPLAALTAWQGLFDHGHLVAGQRVLIHGGAGGVGHFAIQCIRSSELPKHSGASRANTSRAKSCCRSHELTCAGPQARGRRPDARSALSRTRSAVRDRQSGWAPSGATATAAGSARWKPVDRAP